MSAVASTAFPPARGQARGRSRGRSRGWPRGKPRGPYTARGSADNRPVPNFMDLDCFAPSPGNTWPPPDEFGVSRSALAPPPFVGTETFQPRGHPRGDWGGNQRCRGRKRPNESRGPANTEKKVKHGGDEFAFWCDPCSRGFKDKHSWDGHRDTHTTCGIDGCPYVAALKLVKIHKDLQHKTGLAKKIWSLESEESIEKWRQERRKNFPTKEKLAEKDADMAGRLERGELLETKHFGQFRKGREGGRGRGGRPHTYREQRNNHSHGSRGRGYHGNTSMVSHGNQHAVQQKKEEKIVVRDPLSLFETARSDEEEEEEVAEVKKPSGIGGALGALMCNYDDSESESDEGVAPSTCVIDEAENDEFSVVHDEANDQSNVQQQNVVTDVIDDVIKPTCDVTQPQNTDGEQTSTVTETEQKNIFEQPRVDGSRGRRSRDGRGRGRGRGRHHDTPVVRSTLLEKLLAPDIRHERNVILQCIRHISKNNFYGLNGAAPPSDEIVELV